MPCDPHPKRVAQMGKFDGGGDAAQLGDMAPDIVNVTVLDQIKPFFWIVEKLSGGDGRRALGTELGQQFIMLQWHDVFYKIRMIRLNGFGEVDSLVRGQAFMDVMKDME